MNNFFQFVKDNPGIAFQVEYDPMMGTWEITVSKFYVDQVRISKLKFEGKSLDPEESPKAKFINALLKVKNKLPTFINGFGSTF